MRIFALSPCYLLPAGDGVHERRIAEGLGITDQLFVTTFRVFPSSQIKDEVNIGKNGKILVLPIIRPVIFFGFFYSLILALFFSFFRLLGKKAFDVLYVRDLPATISFNIFRRWHNIPVITKTVQFFADETFASRKTLLSRFVSRVIITMEKLATTGADKVIVPSDLFKTELKRRYGVSESRIVSLSSGVDVASFSEMSNQKNKSIFTIGYFGSLGNLHDIDCLLNAIRVLKHSIQIKLVISTRNDTSKLRKKINRYGIDDFVEIKNTPFKMMPFLINEVDAVVIPRYKLSSTDLVLPLKLWEAGAAKKPVIISKTKIVVDLLRDNTTVLFYEPEDFNDLSAKIIQLYEDASLRESLGLKLFAYVKNYDWSIIISRLRTELLELT